MIRRKRLGDPGLRSSGGGEWLSREHSGRDWRWIRTYKGPKEDYASGLTLYWEGRMLWRWPVGPLQIMWQMGWEHDASPIHEFFEFDEAKVDASMPYFQGDGFGSHSAFQGSVMLVGEPDEFVEMNQLAIAVNGFEGSNVEFWLEYEDGGPEDPEIIASRRIYKCPLRQMIETQQREAAGELREALDADVLEFQDYHLCFKSVPAGVSLEGCKLWDSKDACWKAFDAWEKTKAAADGE